nr:MAG TPA: hypothetical protein [Caudoviricetes sp.]
MAPVFVDLLPPSFLWPRGRLIQHPLWRGIRPPLPSAGLRTSRPPISGDFVDNTRKPS